MNVSMLWDVMTPSGTDSAMMGMWAVCDVWFCVATVLVHCNVYVTKHFVPTLSCDMDLQIWMSYLVKDCVDLHMCTNIVHFAVCLLGWPFIFFFLGSINMASSLGHFMDVILWCLWSCFDIHWGHGLILGLSYTDVDVYKSGKDTCLHWDGVWIVCVSFYFFLYIYWSGCDMCAGMCSRMMFMFTQHHVSCPQGRYVSFLLLRWCA